MLHLQPHQVVQIERLIKLLDEGFFEAVGQKALHQQTDGNVEIVISLGNTLDRSRNTSKVETTIVVNQSMIEDGKTRHYFADFEEALKAVEAWHKELFQFEDEDVRVSEIKPPLRIVK